MPGSQQFQQHEQLMQVMMMMMMMMQNQDLTREIDALRRAKEDSERQMEADNAALRREQDGLRGDLESILRELQNILDTKMGLELEIAAYRKLLEGEENRSVTTYVFHRVILS